ncbi:MAG TPA: O-antigen ligase family protein [Coleofasciculaceae cyanobacterium]|jgi:O-antigen ligase
MKQIILNPGVLLAIVTSGVVYFLLTFKLGENRRISSLLHVAFTTITIIAISGAEIFPFNRFHPKWIIFNSVNLVLLLIFYFAAAIVLNSKSRYLLRDFSSLLVKDICLGFFIILILFSGSWSTIPETTFRSSIALVVTSILAAHIGRSYSWKSLSVFIRFSNAFVIFVGALYSIFIPAIGTDEKGWKGALVHPNILGAFICFTIGLWFLDIIENPQDRKISVPALIGLFLVLLLTNSTGSLLNTIILITLTLIIFFFKKLPFRQAFTGFILFMAVSLVVSLWTAENLDAIFGSFGKDTSLTGRTEFWGELVGLVLNKPFVGFGHRGFWLDKNGPAIFIKTAVGFIPDNAHNGFLEIALDLGLLGLASFVLSLIRSICLAFSFAVKSISLDAAIPVLFMVFLIISNISETNILSVNYVWFYYILIAAKLNARNFA